MNKKNRQQRRHPTHPAIPLPQPSGEKVNIKKNIGDTSRGYKNIKARK